MITTTLFMLSVWLQDPATLPILGIDSDQHLDQLLDSGWYPFAIVDPSAGTPTGHGTMTGMGTAADPPAPDDPTGGMPPTVGNFGTCDIMIFPLMVPPNAFTIDLLLESGSGYNPITLIVGTLTVTAMAPDSTTVAYTGVVLQMPYATHYSWSSPVLSVPPGTMVFVSFAGYGSTLGGPFVAYAFESRSF
jgi:hypothetical protein